MSLPTIVILRQSKKQLLRGRTRFHPSDLVRKLFDASVRADTVQTVGLLGVQKRLENRALLVI